MSLDLLNGRHDLLTSYLLIRGTAGCAAHPANAGLRTIATQRGRRLLVDGWWGVARHINYFGDWLMA